MPLPPCSPERHARGLSKAVLLAISDTGSTHLSHFVNGIAPRLAAFGSLLCFPRRRNVPNVRRTVENQSREYFLHSALSA
jgi:hypothetical protein